ncbi:cytochrome c oxidase assembly factor CtaG [Microvirga subterranea]|uniref:Cytochrome c oxidase assembly factor CtaG n=2 Tax=Microvirga subterranea TaxID=186651 RepID=A0A370HKK5_9HYPH|nr:cytochrome c oxidase assembly factor CtaG [Microvirga subterranea]
MGILSPWSARAAAAEPDGPAALLSLCLATLPETTPGQVWTSWSLSPVIVLPLALFGILYMRGIREKGADGRPAVARQVQFAAGMACLILALVSPLCRMAATLAWAHMVQHVLLVAGAPLLLALSRPGDALRQGLPGLLRARIEALPPGSPVVRSHAYLLAGFLLYGANIWLWHIPALYQGALLNTGLHVLMYAVLLAASLLFWHGIIETYRMPGAGSGLAAALLFFTFLHTALLGVLLALSPYVWYPLLAERGAAWGLSALDDQRLAGLIMWIPMGGVYFAAALAILAKLIAGSGRAARTSPAPVQAR